jgi:IrrE N-terminal-like domain
MTTWVEANRLANLAAAQARGDLGIDTATVPIDVYGAIGDAQVVLMWRPMPRQFGAYINEPGSRPGILINNGLPYAAQRQTAGHELGHHFLRHGTRTDVDLDPPGDRRPVWPSEEKLAEAFAAWFLMPRKAVMTALSLLGIQRPNAPNDAYQLSLLLGTPYRATVRHLPSLRLASESHAAAWVKVPPNVIKERLDPAATAPLSRKSDVWMINSRFAGTQLLIHPGDRIVIMDAHPGSRLVSCPEGLQMLPVKSTALQGQLGQVPGRGSSSQPIVIEVGERAVGVPARLTIAFQGSDVQPAGRWEVGIQVEGQRMGIADRWIG